MTHTPNHRLNTAFQTEAELELLQLILEEPISYPLDPAAPEAEAYFEALEQEVLAIGWSQDDFAAQGRILSDRMEQLWASFSAPAAVSISSLKADLLERFAPRMPQSLLDSIVQRAQHVVEQNLSLADQLVQCVQDCLPTWGTDDLHVFARPLAYAMRSSKSEALDSTVKSVRPVDWTELSEVEQARLSLAIARYAIAQMSDTPIDLDNTLDNNTSH